MALWKDGVQVGTTYSYPLTQGEWKLSPYYLNASGAIAGLAYRNGGYDRSTFVCTAGGAPVFAHGSNSIPPTPPGSTPTDSTPGCEVFGFNNAGILWGEQTQAGLNRTHTPAAGNYDFIGTTTIPFLHDPDRPPADPDLGGDLGSQFAPQLVNSSQQAIGTKFAATGSFRYLGGEPIALPAKAILALSDNGTILGLNPGHPPVPDLRINALSAFLSPVTTGLKIDIASSLPAEFRKQIAFDENTTAQITSTGDILFHSLTLEGPEDAPAWNRKAILWTRSNISSANPHGTLDQVTNPGGQLNEGHFMVGISAVNPAADPAAAPPAEPASPYLAAMLKTAVKIQVKVRKILASKWVGENDRRVDNLLSVWGSHPTNRDWVQVRVVSPDAIKNHLPAAFIKWEVGGFATPIADNTLETPRLRWPGSFGVKKITIDFPTIRMEKFLYVDVPDLGMDGTAAVSNRWIAADPVGGRLQIGDVYKYAAMADTWTTMVPGLSSSHRNALKHAYWMALCASDKASLGAAKALEWGIAYEIDDKYANNSSLNPANEATMDLHNDRVGAATVFSDSVGEPIPTRIQTASDQKHRDGDLMILDGPGNEHEAPGLDLLIKSNNKKYYLEEESH